MAVADVGTFLDRAYTDLAFMAQVRAAKGATNDETAANVVQLAAAAGFHFTADEYRSTVEDEVAALFRLHRSVAHHVLLTVTI